MSKFSGLALAVDKPQRMTILHPVSRVPMKDADGNEAYLDLFSGDSEAARKHDRAILRDRLNKPGKMKLTPEQLEASTPDRLSALTAGWHLVDLDGNVIDVQFSRDNAKDLFAEPAMSWLRDDAQSFVDDRGNFLPASSTS